MRRLIVFKLKSPTFGVVESNDLKELINVFAENKKYKILVGTDSHAKNSHVLFATAIVIYRIGNGGTYFYNIKYEQKHYDMFSRLIKEAELSLKVAEFLENYLNFKKPEVHLDIGLNGKSKEVFNTITGYVKGLGYDYKIKPESFAATSIAHLYTK
ncbi:hypothetical protein PW5551_00600 [Petrotoga sp. 9PW.55.5.1]|jgi:hypothetical protein|nr:hypothetical protein PW5551_00600 [Petrotoga sp. 9PW.55.5.1]